MNNIENQSNYSLSIVLFIVWTVVSIILFLIIIFPLLFEEQFVLQMSPSCVSAKYGVECTLCGMTRGFIEISKGNLSEATSLNKGSVWLFAVMFLNTLIYITFAGISQFSLFNIIKIKQL